MENLSANVLEDVLFVILLNKNPNFNVKAPYDIEILGKKMWEWVALSGAGAEIITIPCDEDYNVISLIKTCQSTKPITMVFYADTPRLTRGAVLQILDHFKTKNLNVLKLKRGFVFNSEYLKECESVLVPESELFAGKELQPVCNMADVVELTKELKKKIINYHINNGVYIVDENSTYIDADVVIESGARVEPNNTLKGQSYIAEDVVLEPNNVIKNSIVCKNATIKNSYISGSQVSENAIVGPFGVLIDKKMWG